MTAIAHQFRQGTWLRSLDLSDNIVMDKYGEFNEYNSQSEVPCEPRRNEPLQTDCLTESTALVPHEGGDDSQVSTMSAASSKTSGKRKLHVEQMWEFLEEANNTDVSLRKLAKVRRKDRQGGAHQTSVEHWMRNALQMYFDRSSLAFMNINRLYVATDNSVHSGRDMMVSIAANPARDQRCRLLDESGGVDAQDHRSY